MFVLSIATFTLLLHDFLTLQRHLQVALQSIAPARSPGTFRTPPRLYSQSIVQRYWPTDSFVKKYVENTFCILSGITIFLSVRSSYWNSSLFEITRASVLFFRKLLV